MLNSSLVGIQRQLLLTAQTLEEIKELEKETEVTVNLIDLDSRIRNLYDRRLNKLESDVSVLTALIEELKNLQNKLS
jgi:hypothetical protein